MANFEFRYLIIILVYDYLNSLVFIIGFITYLLFFKNLIIILFYYQCLFIRF